MAVDENRQVVAHPASRPSRRGSRRCATDTLPLVSSRIAFSIVLPSFMPFLIFCFFRPQSTPATRTDCSTRAARSATRDVGEAPDLVGEPRQRMARDVEAERLLLALELLVERPLGQLREVVRRRPVALGGAAAEQVRLAARLVLAASAPRARPPARTRRRASRGCGRASRTRRPRSARRGCACSRGASRAASAKSVNEANGRVRRSSRIACAAASPTPLIAARPKRIDVADGREALRRLVDVGRQHRRCPTPGSRRGP